jgi:hypothetical protein
MTTASGSKTKLRFIKEVTPGVTPASAAMQELDYVSFEGNLEAPTVDTNIISPTRQRKSARRGNVSVTGNMATELCSTNWDWALEGLFQSTFSSDVLKPGSTASYFSMEQEFSDLTKFRVFKGVMLNTLAVATTTDNYVTATFGLLGYNASPFSGTSVAASSAPVVSHNSFYHEGGTFDEGGVAVGAFTNISFNITNNGAVNNTLGVTGVRSITSGRFDVSGSMTALFEDETLYNKFINDTDSTLVVKFVDGTKSLEFSFPKVKYTAATVPVSNNGVISVNLNFIAVYDDTSAATVVVTRDNT